MRIARPRTQACADPAARAEIPLRRLAAHNAAMVRAACLLGISLLAGVTAHAEIFRCTASSGAVSYQQVPCDGGERFQVMDLPASYPPVDSAQRDRLFQREAALDQRLEARRERESREAIARSMQPAQPAQAQPQEPQLLWFLPPALRPHHRGQNLRIRPPFMR